jgi:hypothetical protein
MKNLTLTIHFCDISQSFVSATKYENTSSTQLMYSCLVSIHLHLNREVPRIHLVDDN